MNKLLLFLFLFTAPLYAVTPMHYYTDLVAGDDDPGCQDGVFDEARFDEPSGMVFDDAGKRLFVADTKNNRIRVIHMDEDHRVETLARLGTDPKESGSLDQMPLSEPQNLVYLPGDHLLVYEKTDQALFLLDLGKKTFRLLANGVGKIWSLAYRQEDNALYMTETTKGQLKKLDLTTGQFSVPFEGLEKIVTPLALCIHDGTIFVSDLKSSEIYKIETPTDEIPSITNSQMSPLGRGSRVVEMVFGWGCLYALQADNEPLAEIWPEARKVALPSIGGFELSASPSYTPLFQGSSKGPMGLATSSREEQRFFISQPRPNTNSIISVVDDRFDEHWYARDAKGENRELTDFDYPTQKPPKTFRILVVGTSRVVTAPTAVSLEDLEKGSVDLNDRDYHSLRLHTFAKRLELLLNTQAALEGRSERFEVLELGRPGMKVQFFANEQVPPLVEKYDVDLVLTLLTPTFEEAFADYFTRPMTEEGIPGGFDAEYLMKPWKERVPPGVPGDFLKQCFDRKLVQESPEGNLTFGFFQDLLENGGPDVRQGLIEMLGKPLQLLSHRLNSLKVASSGKSPQLKFFFVPNPDCDSFEQYEAFWLDLSAQKGLELLDLSKPYEDLKYSYYPDVEACCHRHYTAYGNELIAQLLDHYLPQKGWIPLGTAGSK